MLSTDHQSLTTEQQLNGTSELTDMKQTLS